MPISKPKRSGKKATLDSYVFKILKQVHPGVCISKSAVSCAASLIETLSGRLSESSSDIAKSQKKGTLSAKHVQTAVRLVLPSELALHAVGEGTKAVTKFAAV